MNIPLVSRSRSVRQRLFGLLVATLAIGNLVGAPLSQSVSSDLSRFRFTWVLDGGQLSYGVADAAPGLPAIDLIERSPLGLTRSDGDFTNGLTFVSAEAPRKIDESYSLVAGKRLNVRHQAVEQTFNFKNSASQPMTLTVQVMSDSVAFRYGFPGGAKGEVLVSGEATGFKLPAKGDAWMLPYDDQAEWAVAYEAIWQNKIKIGTTSSTKSGWAFPALFHTANHWFLVTEAGLDGTCYGAHLEPQAPDGLYRIRLPEEWETCGVAHREAKITTPWQSPWRIVVIGPTPAAIVETDVVTHLSPPNTLGDTSSWLKPGRVSWSWWSDKGSPSDRNRLVPFVDLSADYGWEYSLVDGGWEHIPEADRNELIAYAAKKKVGLILWYNSGGPHNKIMFGLRDLMDKPDLRRKEFAKIAKWGIKGVKVDFMQSDQQYVIKLYNDILRDAAAEHLFVDFHGSTTPRGWARTYPNLLSQEGIRGAEQYWDKVFADNAHTYHTIYPYTRNVVGSMDYTPVIFGDAPELERHQTTNGHELAQSVAFESGVQHFVDSVSAYRIQPNYVQDFLKHVPVAWDETRYLDGVPGELVLLARRKGSDWYIACLNGEATKKKITVPLAFLGSGKYDAEFIVDGESQHKFPEKPTKLTVTSADKPVIDVDSKGGFTARLTPAK